ncbi:hypothetical protein T01_7371 [Trichinella spiralis]|uniref:Uncharacterized protein n=1 Tax=Trichinella spiralis TaxID=6334 RepID=A0A0V1BAS4_TRISP|nr:hypothetical protein T01_7371 [Trichinella spiralis]
MSAVGKVSQPKRSDTAAKAKTLLLRGKALLASVVPRIMYRLHSKYDASLSRARSVESTFQVDAEWTMPRLSGAVVRNENRSGGSAKTGKWKARQFGAGRVCESVKAKPSASSSKCIAVEFGQVRPRAWADQLGAWSGYLFRTMSRPLAISSLMVCLLIIQATDPNPLRRQGQRRLLYRIYFGTSMIITSALILAASLTKQMDTG